MDTLEGEVAVLVNDLDKASEPWGIKVLRYEIKNISPPKDVLAAMEKQMRAEREKRAVILTSEGERDATINAAEGQKQQVIKASEDKKQQQINTKFGELANATDTTMIVPAGVADVASMIAMAMNVIGRKPGGATR
jgi:regulator of protease activity HflC (stomatin/prohibitin superfamily)